MAAQVNAPVWQVGDWRSAFNNAVTAIGANLCLVADSGADRGVKVPANGANTTIVNFGGVAQQAIAAGKVGRVAREPGDVVVCKANGAVTRGDTVFATSADAQKEGFVKSYTNFGADGVVFIVGVALTTAADGEYVEVMLQGLYLKTA